MREVPQIFQTPSGKSQDMFYNRKEDYQGIAKKGNKKDRVKRDRTQISTFFN